MFSPLAFANPLSWQELLRRAAPEQERVQGVTNAQSNLRLFGHDFQSVRVILYRDHHAWCPYCQKIWLWLEFKRVPYIVHKVTMRCYGTKEPWFLRKVPSGMLPALEVDGQLVTESDSILLCLEEKFGPLGHSMVDRNSLELRQLERLLFRAWCIWLCTPGLTLHQQKQAKEQFKKIAQRLEKELETTPGPWLRSDELGTIDLVFVPYLERMNASLAYYKGYRLRREHPYIDRWFRALESLDSYRGTQSDMHTHVHDLPPQMGGCWTDDTPLAADLAARIDRGEGLGEDEAVWPEDSNCGQAAIALGRVLRHRRQLLRRNPLGSEGFDLPLRCALTCLITSDACQPPRGCAAALRHLRDRISVPRDMPLPAGRLLRQALEVTAALDGPQQAKRLGVRDRFDQDPRDFLNRQ
ncbi:glutathione S-transferase family protein [Synechococcus sp. M16CYN]|uniref:glutathione S-transferase family protein n=1 Tax=Synechococcus sp. M16CYN TaxID=3103139 RepID=UPI0030E22B99